MFGGPFFQDLQQAFMGGLGDFAQQQQQPQQPKGIPPASRKFIESLKELQITADDLIEENNKECLVCLDEQKVGGLGVKLHCGHLYHRACLVDWLNRHCTCPCCRFEVESDDADYEKERRLRMKKRKLRMRADEISHKSLSQLRELCRSLQVSIIGCLDKTEIVDRLVKSGKIEITEGCPAVEITRSDFMRRGVGELRHMLLSYGLSDEGAIEKKELRSRLENSGRLVIIEDEKASDDAMGGYATARADSVLGGDGGGGGGAAGGKADSLDESRPDHHSRTGEHSAPRKIVAEESATQSTASSSAPAAAAAPTVESSAATFALSASLLAELPVREIKSILSSHNIDASRCVERRDLVDLLRADKRFTISDD